MANYRIDDGGWKRMELFAALQRGLAYLKGQDRTSEYSKRD
jgi:hypothetical protein